LLDAYRDGGLDALAQVDLDVRQNAHQRLRDLGPMADAVLQAVATRLQREGRVHAAVAAGVVERPPVRTLRAAA
jgi:glucosyl-3-phosphoglycerate synthase